MARKPADVTEPPAVPDRLTPEQATALVKPPPLSGVLVPRHSDVVAALPDDVEWNAARMRFERPASVKLKVAKGAQVAQPRGRVLYGGQQFEADQDTADALLGQGFAEPA